MAETFKNIPEIFETETGSALRLRDESLGAFQDLGASDLINVIKSNPKLQAKELSSFHYVMGVDTSSSASIAAYMNSLTYSMEDSGGWFAKPTWKITSGTFCCYNAFSRMDIRVEIHIPGGVKTSAIYADGQSVPATADLWQEAYLSSMLRCIWDQDINYTGLRKMDPLTSAAHEKKFLDACKALFMRGILLGCDEEYQMPTAANNYLARGVLKYFVDTQRPLMAAEFFKDFVTDEPEVSALMAEAYLRADEEVKAVKILHRALKATPKSLALLHVQSKFLKSKGEFDWASKIAKYSVDYSPSEYLGWENLTQLAIDIKDMNKAIVCMNASPMSSYYERENIPRCPPPQRVHVPLNEKVPDVDYLDSEPDFYLNNPNNIDPALQSLQAANLKGTLRKSYLLLTQLCSLIGWDDLLALRSSAFVMEEEYFQLRNVTEKQRKEVQPPMDPLTPLNPLNSHDPLSPKDATSQSATLPSPGEKSEVLSNSTPNAVSENSTAQASPNPPPPLDSNKKDELDEAKDEASKPPMRLSAKTSETSLMLKSPRTMSHTRHSSKLVERVSNKRLCERWLDSLFMLLYEDLRVYTIWRAEIQHFKSQSLDYRRTAAEWEILGFLALRLNHREEAKEAFAASLDQRYSNISASQLLKLLEEDGKIKETLSLASKMIAYNEHVYQHCIYPSFVGKYIFSLIRRYGMSRIKSSLKNSSLSSAHQALFQPFFKYVETLQTTGHDQ